MSPHWRAGQASSPAYTVNRATSQQTLNSAQLAEVLPPAQLLARMFAAFPVTGAAVLDAVCSLAAVAFAFVVMPAGDVLMGRDLQGGASMVRPSQGWCL